MQLTAIGGTLDPTSVTLHVSINGGVFTATPMSEIDTNLYSATLPPASCLETLAFYFSAALGGGLSWGYSGNSYLALDILRHMVLPIAR